MNLLTSFFFLNAGRAGAVAGGGGGVLGLVLGFFALFFIQPYYEASIRATTEFIGISPFNPIVPISLMVAASAMFLWPIYEIANGERNGLLFFMFRRIMAFAMMVMSIPLFIFAFIHWAFATT